MNSDPIFAIQESIAKFIIADSRFASIPVVITDKGDLMESVSRVAGNCGLVIAIEPVTTDLGYSGEKVVFTFAVAVTVAEIVLINRSRTGTNIRASELVASLVLLFRPRNNPPCAFMKVDLKQDSGGKCEYTLTGMAKSAV